MELPESQMKDSQLLRLLEQPVPPTTPSATSLLRVSERSQPAAMPSFSREEEEAIVPEIIDDDEDDDMFMFTRSTLNLVNELWNSSKSMLQNLKLIMGFLQSYAINQGKVDPKHVRIREAKVMKDALASVVDAWKKKRRRGCSAACSLDEFNIFVVEEKLAATLSEDIMMENTFTEWLEDFKVYVNRRPTLRVDTAAKSSSGDGLNALFGASNFCEEVTDERVSQYIIKLENGRVHTVRTPGEVGQSLIRLDVYEVRDILKREKRDWWKYAKMRTQFLTSSPTDSKQQLLKQLLDLAADDLIGISGLRREVSSSYTQ